MMNAFSPLAVVKESNNLRIGSFVKAKKNLIIDTFDKLTKINEAYYADKKMYYKNMLLNEAYDPISIESIVNRKFREDGPVRNLLKVVLNLCDECDKDRGPVVEEIIKSLYGRLIEIFGSDHSTNGMLMPFNVLSRTINENEANAAVLLKTYLDKLTECIEDNKLINGFRSTIYADLQDIMDSTNDDDNHSDVDPDDIDRGNFAANVSDELEDDDDEDDVYDSNEDHEYEDYEESTRIEAADKVGYARVTGCPVMSNYLIYIVEQFSSSHSYITNILSVNFDKLGGNVVDMLCHLIICYNDITFNILEVVASYLAIVFEKASSYHDDDED